MERPNLIFNYYYPFYTQCCIGTKKYYYKVETIVHLSDKRGVLLSISYKSKKPYEVEIKELDDSHTLFDKKDKGELIHYTSFAKEVEKVYRLLSGAKRQLASEKPYKKRFIFTTYLKHTQSVEIEIAFRDIHVTFDCSNYIIEAGRVKRNASSEEDGLLKKLGDAISVFDAQTTFLELEEKEFNDKLDNSWSYFIEYFKSPKFIKKGEYLPK